MVDVPFASKLAADLETAGMQVWIDVYDLGAGPFQEDISKALANCQWFLLVLSPFALDSAWVRMEVDAAIRLKHKKRITQLIFVKAAEVDPDQIPALWGIFNVFDASTDYNAALTKTLNSIKVPHTSSGESDAQNAPSDATLAAMVETTRPYKFPHDRAATFDSDTELSDEQILERRGKDWTHSVEHDARLSSLSSSLATAESLIDDAKYEAALHMLDKTVYEICSILEESRESRVRYVYDLRDLRPRYRRAWFGIAKALSGLGQTQEAKEAEETGLRDVRTGLKSRK
jgi:hypothetical protein